MQVAVRGERSKPFPPPFHRRAPRHKRRQATGLTPKQPALREHRKECSSDNSYRGKILWHVRHLKAVLPRPSLPVLPQARSSRERVTKKIPRQFPKPSSFFWINY